MKSKIGLIFIILLLAGAGLYGQGALNLFQKPCSQPITYSLGSFDNQFHLSQADFLADIDKAVSIWEQPLGKDLFEYSDKGRLQINLVYDYRQQATDKLKSLGVVIDDTKGSYDAVKLRYDQMTADFKRLKTSLEAAVAAYNAEKQTYEQQVSYWNQRGGAPKNVVTQLNAKRDDLAAKAEKINRDQETLNSLADTINSIVPVLNRMAQSLNLSVTDYNQVGQSRGEEFEEGAYVVSGRTQRIDIYEFDTNEKLVRVLAHELGHALGLEHVDSDPEAIMYRLNQGKNEKLTSADILAAQKLCGI